MHPILDALLPALRTAGARALAGPGRMHLKADGSEVTAADLEVEALLSAGLAAAFPADGQRGEEGASRPGDPWWTIDPIDGTANFLGWSRGEHGDDRPGAAEGWWGPALARLRGGVSEVGILYYPARDELWFAAAGDGASRAGRPLAPLDGPGLQDDDLVLVPRKLRRHAELARPFRTGSLRCTTAQMARVAGGDAAATLISPGWGPWDVTPGLALLAEVGGGAWTLDGQPLNPLDPFAPPFVAGREDRAFALAAALRPRGG
jgi:myo-inositol-1(or 4)-monophosphatase